MLQTLVGALDDVVIGEHLLDADALLRRPALVLRRDFRGDVNALTRVANHSAHQLLAVPFAIRQRRVDEVQAQFNGAAQRSQGLFVRPALPLAATDAPCAVADLADLKTGPPQFAGIHTDHPTK